MTERTVYRIQHVTTYTYESDVTGSYGMFHLRPRDLDWQRCLSHEVTVDPEPSDLDRHVDLYGNTKSYFHVTTPHTVLRVTSVSTVDLDVHTVAEEHLSLAWEKARPEVADDADAWRAVDFIYPSPMIDVPPGIEEYARESFPAGRPIGEAALDLMRRVHADFRYQPGSTTVSTRVADLLQSRRGVCQDFSHFMVSCLRSLGLAGRYVSGYLATTPPPGRPRLVGADASHAWVGCWTAGGGWLYLDPTNNRQIDASHATVAWGRDYSDVPPVKGVIFTEAKKSTMKVGVDMAPLER